MRIIILATAALSIINITQAAYTIKIPFEQAQGGALPNGSINITPRTPSIPAENWQPTVPLLGEWINNGAIYGCTNWTPSASTVLKDEPFNQSATDCKQDQTSTKQDREQETTTLAYRNVGAPVSTTKTITASSSRTATGTAACSYSSDFWVSVLGGGVNYYSVYVNGVRIKTASGSSTTSFTLNDITYKRGTTRKYFSGNYDYYDVCK